MTAERGFTLLEVMIALAILAIALPILLGLRNHDVLLFDEAGRVSIATRLAQEKLVESETGGFPPLGQDSGDFAAPSPGAPGVPEYTDRAPGYRWTRTVGPTAFDAVREVTVRVAWARGTTEAAVEVTRYAFTDRVKAAPAGEAAGFQ